MVFGFFKRKNKVETTQEEILAVVEELVSTDEQPNNADNDVDYIDNVQNEIITEDDQCSINVLAEKDFISRNDTAVIVGEVSIDDDSISLAEATVNTTSNADEVVADEEPKVVGKLSWAQRLARGLGKTRDSFNKKLLGVFGGGQIDDDLYDELESVLLTSDVGINATEEILEKVRNKVSLKGLKDSNELKQALKESLIEVVEALESPLQIKEHQPFVIMMVGVNGAGKTTSIGKLAKYFQAQGKSVMLAAGDTFRAAAREQLIEWGKRNNVTVVTQQSGDSAAVCFDAIQSAIAKKVDVVLADTAGRLPTQLHLMEEIKKVKKVINKALPDAPHEVMLVLDANIGQNAINQVKAFDDALGLTGLILTKLDGTAKGGVVCAIAKERKVALRFIGVGESIDDLRPFHAAEYVNALLGDDELK